MHSSTLTKAAYQRMVRSMCLRCMPVGLIPKCDEKDCPCWPGRLARVKDPDQTHLLRINSTKEFREQALKVACGFTRPFIMEDVRRRYRAKPLNDNWWGGLTLTKEWRGTFQQTGKTIASGIGASRHRRLVEWERRNGRLPIDKRSSVH